MQPESRDEAHSRQPHWPVTAVSASWTWAREQSSPLIPGQGTGGSFAAESDLHLLGTGDLASLAAERPDLRWDLRRFRPNLFVGAEPGTLDPRHPAASAPSTGICGIPQTHRRRNYVLLGGCERIVW
jgi:hypothetical protein